MKKTLIITGVFFGSLFATAMFILWACKQMNYPPHPPAVFVGCFVTAILAVMVTLVFND